MNTEIPAGSALVVCEEGLKTLGATLAGGAGGENGGGAGAVDAGATGVAGVPVAVQGTLLDQAGCGTTVAVAVVVEAPQGMLEP